LKPKNYFMRNLSIKILIFSICQIKKAFHIEMQKAVNYNLWKKSTH
jgi:hypothetical protein